MPDASVALTSTAFDIGTATVAVTGTGVTVANKVVVKATTIMAQFQIGAMATTGARNVTVANGNTPSSPLTFTVVASATPTLTSVTPSTGYRDNGSVCSRKNQS